MDNAVSLDAKPRTGERRSQAARRDEAEQRLLQAAVRIVAEQGLERFTLAEVGEAAGYSRGLPAHYFGSKEGLIAALAAHIVGGFGSSLVRDVKLADGLPRLLGTVSYYFESAGRKPMVMRALFALLGEAITNATLRKKIADLNAQSVAALADNIRAGIAAGQIRRSVDVKAEATMILSGLRGAVALWLVDPKGVDLDALRKDFVASLKRSLVP